MKDFCVRIQGKRDLENCSNLETEVKFVILLTFLYFIVSIRVMDRKYMELDK